MRLDELLPILLVQVGLVLVLSRLMGALCSRFHQPQVVGEMMAGIMLGPSVLGLLSAWFVAHGWLGWNLSAAIFPPQSIPFLGILSQIGVVFFLFLVGLELDPKLLRNRGHAAVVISHVSIVAPLLLGAALTLFLYPRLFNAGPRMHFAPVALFMGAAMSITAFPVLARILTERNLTRTKVGAVAITCAAVDDVTAWCMLAFVVAVARAKGIHSAVITAALSAGYVVVMFFVIKPFVARLRLIYEREGRLSRTVFAIVLLLILASAWTTERIGIHALFGAFVMGAIMPKEAGFVRGLSDKLEDFTLVFLLPIFFAYTGLKTQIGLLNSPELWWMTALVVLVACVGKFGGSTLAARACGLSWREGAAIGILMNTRGLMELVILNIGRDLGVITPVVFAMMVIMALVTTFMTTPLLQLVMPRRLYAPVVTSGEKARRGFSVLIPVAHPKSGGPLLQLAATLVDPGVERSILALHLRRPVDRDAYQPQLVDQRTPEGEEPLRPLMSHAQKHGIPVEAISFSSIDVAAGIAEVAHERAVSLVMIGFHHSVFSRTMLGGTVHRVLQNVDTDVAVFVDRDYRGAKRILVPYLGGEHDRLALQLVARAARGTQVEIVVLHVTPVDAARSSKASSAKADVERTLAPRAGQPPITWQFTHVDDPSPVDVVLRESAKFDLVVIGVSEEWGLESQLFGLRPERIAEQSPTSMLMVRKHGESRDLAELEPPAVSAPAEPAQAPA